MIPGGAPRPPEAPNRRPPGVRPLVASLATVVLVGCGTVAGGYRSQDGLTGPDPGFRTQPVEPATAQHSSQIIARRLGEKALSIGGGSSARGGWRHGAKALAPSTAGTLVAHALTEAVVAYRAPDLRSETLITFHHPTSRGGPLVFQAVGPPGDGWLEVLLPVRPNGTTGWIRLDDIELTVNPYRIEIDASAYRLTVYRYGRVQMSTTIAVGNGDTPTPMGDFYLVELLRPTNPDGLYGPFAYGLSGYSDTLETFNGGRGMIGIHGTNQPELLGRDVSHGCIRVANPTIAAMTGFLPLGTPVSIFRHRPGEAGEPNGGEQDEPHVAEPAYRP